MKTVLITLLSFFFAVSIAKGQKLTILHTNDLHSRLIGYAPSADYSPETIADDSTYGGFARMAGYFNQVQQELGEKPLILDGGDFLMGTLFHTLEPEEGFQLRLMKKMGYDVLTIGNHEFDLGVHKLGQIIQTADDRGEIPNLVLSNIQFHPAETEDDLLEDLYKRKIVQQTLVKEYKGIRIGFFGLMGDEAAQVAPYARPASFTDRILAATEMTRYLREDQKADLIICLSHSGLWPTKKGGWSGEDAVLASKVPGIDLIISGHTHTQLFEPLVINNTIIVQAGSEGRFVGRLDLDWNGEALRLDNHELKVMDDMIAGDPIVQREILEYESLIIDKVFSSLQLKAGVPVCETDFDLLFNEQSHLETSNLGPLVADAIQWYVNRTRPSDMTMVAGGLIRESISKGSSGQQRVNDLFRIVPLGSGVFDDSPGYSLAQVYLTARELKNVFEAMMLAPKMSTSNYPFWSGVKYKYNPRRIMLDQVYEISLGNEQEGYTPIDISGKNKQLYSLTTNNYILEFVGLIGEATFGLLKVVPKDQYGQAITDMNQLVLDGDPDKPGLQEMKEWAALIAYVGQFADTNGNQIPDIPDYYRIPHPAGERTPSLHPVSLWGNGNGIMAVASLATITILAATGLIILL